MRILFDSNSHYPMSVATIFLSVASFFVVYYLLNLLVMSTIFNLFYETIWFPGFYLSLFLIFLIAFPIDSFLLFIQTIFLERDEEKKKKIEREYKRQFTQGLDLSQLAPLRRYTGFAFSGEAGHTP